MDWIKTTEQKPEIGREVEGLYGTEIMGGMEYMKERHCMLAGIAGGNGYFDEGFGTSRNSGTDYGLICDEPDYWRYID